MLVPTLLIGLTVAATTIGLLVRHRDTFHPAALIGPMLAFAYCYSPLRIAASDGFYGFLWDDHVSRAQWVHLAGVAALCAGLWMGGRHRQQAYSEWHFNDRILVRGALLLGAAGIASFLYGISNVGGFLEAYGRSYGGGYAESGWVRDLTILPLPALVLLTISHQAKSITWRSALLALTLISPFLIHGLLGARRGPTFMGVVGLTMAYYMARQRRPALLTLCFGGAVLGALMLALVANRDAVYWGTDEELEATTDRYFKPGSGNDFIYGAGLIIVADELETFGWGTTYLTTLFIRPIPREIWPTKYEDAAEFFGTPVLDENLGVDITAFRSVLGWTGAVGAAPGIVSDMWREFSWGMLPVLLGLGWAYSRVWSNAVYKRGPWIPLYCFLASLSIYLVMQTLEAMLSRFLFGVVPMLIVLRLSGRRMKSHGSQSLEASGLWTTSTSPSD